MTPTSKFTATLRDQISTAQDALLAAQQAGRSRQVYLHSARLLDLLDRAAREGVETSGWVPADILAAAHAACPNGD